MLLIHGDCIEVLTAMESESIDALITDPPAGISFMGKDWDGDRGGRDAWIAWMCEVMTECYRVLKPGAHGLVWALPRTSHWTATALESAGFEVRDVVNHIFGTGFPKSLNVAKALEKAGQDPAKGEGIGTALKPAHEHWILVRKPLSEKTVAANVLKHGTGGINVDGCRIGYQDERDKNSATPQGKVTSKKPEDGYAKSSGIDSERHEIERPELKGRFPANLILSEESAAELDAHSGYLHGSGQKSDGPQDTRDSSIFNIGGPGRTKITDKGGGASRFFYVAKASKSDKGADNRHPTVKSTTLMEYLITLITPRGGVVLDPFMGSGSTGVAADRLGLEFYGIEKCDEYFEMAKTRLECP